jgi:hypothetical protein
VIDKHVLSTAVVFKNILGKYGIKFSFPKSTDISKTYHYRWVQGFIDKCKNDYGANDNDIPHIVAALVKYSKSKNLLNCGIYLLNRSDIIEICCKEFKNSLHSTNSLYNNFKDMNDYINKICHDRYTYFIKNEKNSFPNIVLLKMKNIINDNFISCSKSAIKSINILDENDKHSFLSMKDYIILKYKMINHLGKEKLVSLFKGDYNE